MKTYDALVIGGGIAGVSLGYELAADRSVGLLEMENTLAFHTTGRSAATFTESSGGPVMRALTRSSRAFLEDPPEVFESEPLSPLPLLVLGPQGGADAVRTLHQEVSTHVPDVRLVDSDEAQQICPLLQPGYVELALLEPGGMALDVHCVHQGYKRGLRQRGGVVHTSASVATMHRRRGVWHVTDTHGETYEAPVIVDAAGAWCDVVAGAAGAWSAGIRPLRRSIFMVAAPPEPDPGGLPFIGDIAGTFYLKPDGDQFMCSPSEETLMPPGDVRADAFEIARAIDAINTATTLNLTHVRSSWAGLRSIAPDRLPVVGFDPVAEGFFWFAGQGGYGIQAGPALARMGAALLRGLPVPADVDTGQVPNLVESVKPGRQMTGAGATRVIQDSCAGE